MIHYFDLSKLGICVGIVVGPDDQVVYTGTKIHREPEQYRHLEKPFEALDFHFWFGEDGPAREIYTVPGIELAGFDSQGGFFAGCPDFSLREQVPMYYIDRENRCHLITPDSGKFLTMGPSWRDNLVPTEAIEIFDSYEQAARRYGIQRPENEEELMNMLKGEWDA